MENQTPLLQQLRENLKPQGTKAIVRLHMTGFFTEPFVKKAIDELENNAILTRAGLQELSALEILAFELLKESAGI